MNYLFKCNTTYWPKYVILRLHAPLRARARFADALLALPTGFKLLRSLSRSPLWRNLRRHHVASSGTPCLVGNSSTPRPHRLASGGKSLPAARGHTPATTRPSCCRMTFYYPRHTPIYNIFGLLGSIFHCCHLPDICLLSVR